MPHNQSHFFPGVEALASDVAAIGLGSNLGDRGAQIASACGRLAEVLDAPVSSKMYATEPVGYTEQPEFLNAVVIGRWSGTPEALLAVLHDIERSGGRTRGTGPRFGPRTIDLDILLFGTIILHKEQLTIPHPRMHERRFALDPLLELYPDLVDPLSGTPFSQFAAQLPSAGIYEYGKPPI